MDNEQNRWIFVYDVKSINVPEEAREKYPRFSISYRATGDVLYECATNRDLKGFYAVTPDGQLEQIGDRNAKYIPASGPGIRQFLKIRALRRLRAGKTNLSIEDAARAIRVLTDPAFTNSSK